MPGKRMLIKHLQLKQFRNLRALELEPHPRANLLLGANAQGKTNLLEGLFLLSTTKSLRAAGDAELIMEGKAEALARAEVLRETSGAERTLEVLLAREGKRTLKLGGKAVRRHSEFFGQLAVVLFTPADLDLVQAGPAQRRAWLDLELSQASPAYLRHLQDYHHALKQRNAALRLLAEGRGTRAMVEAFDAPLAAAGAQVLSLRDAAVRELAPLAAHVQAAVGQGEALGMDYQSTVPLAGAVDALAAAFTARLAETQREESARGLTLVGPHRDDLLLSLDGRPARGFASQGQQRTVALALKLAEVDYLKGRLGEPPVLLLDDVLSELDKRRQAALLGLLDQRVQTFLSSTSADGLPLDPGRSWELRGGELKRL